MTQSTTSSPDVLPATGPARGLLSRLRVPTSAPALPTVGELSAAAPTEEGRYTPTRGAGVFARLLLEQEEAERAAQARGHEVVPAPRNSPEAEPAAAGEIVAASPLRNALQAVSLHAEVAALRAEVAGLEALREELLEAREHAARLERELDVLRESTRG